MITMKSERQVGGKYLLSMLLVVLTAESDLKDREMLIKKTLKNTGKVLLKTLGFHISACIWLGAYGLRNLALYSAILPSWTSISNLF